MRIVDRGEGRGREEKGREEKFDQVLAAPTQRRRGRAACGGRDLCYPCTVNGPRKPAAQGIHVIGGCEGKEEDTTCMWKNVFDLRVEPSHG